MDAKVAIPAAPSGNKSQRTRDRDYASRKHAGGGGGGGGDWNTPSDHYGPQEEATEAGPREQEREREPDQRERKRERKPKQPSRSTCGGEECVLNIDKERGFALSAGTRPGREEDEKTIVIMLLMGFSPAEPRSKPSRGGLGLRRWVGR